MHNLVIFLNIVMMYSAISATYTQLRRAQARAKTPQHNLMLNTIQRMNVYECNGEYYFYELRHGMFHSTRRK